MFLVFFIGENSIIAFSVGVGLQKPQFYPACEKEFGGDTLFFLERFSSRAGQWGGC